MANRADLCRGFAGSELATISEGNGNAFHPSPLSLLLAERTTNPAIRSEVFHVYAIDCFSVKPRICPVAAGKYVSAGRYKHATHASNRAVGLDS